MLVRYRINSTCTLANFQTDINNIILGNIATTADLSSGADKTNSVVLGTYTTGIYNKVNASTYTYSKAHNSITGYTHYFRLTFDATQLTTIALAQSYTSGTDTLVNSSATTVNIQRFTFNSVLQNGIDIIVSNKMLVFFAPQSGVLIGIVDLGHSATTRAYTNSMLMVLQDFGNVPNWGATSQSTILANTGGTIPYTYNYDTASYATVVTGISGAQTTRKTNTPGSTTIFENPLFCNGGGAANLMYGCYRIPYLSFNGVQLYKDASNLYRLTVYDNSLLVD
jgi:hypothetical protein